MTTLYVAWYVGGFAILWGGTYGVILQLTRWGWLGGEGRRDALKIDLAFDHLNYVHACITTLLGMWLLRSDSRLWEMDPIVESWSSEVEICAALTLGYLAIDVCLQLYLSYDTLVRSGNLEYTAFHTTIALGFASCVLSSRGAVVVAWGLFSEIDSIVKGWQLQLDLALRAWGSSRPNQPVSPLIRILTSLKVPLAGFQVLLFALSRVLVFVWLCSALHSQTLTLSQPSTLFFLLASDPLLLLQVLLVHIGLAFNLAWFLHDLNLFLAITTS